MGHQLSLSFALPHPFPGWSLCVSRQLSTPISTLKGAEQRQAGEPISQRVDRCLERQRWLEQDTESVLLNPTEDTDAAPIQREGGLQNAWKFRQVCRSRQQSQRGHLLPIGPLCVLHRDIDLC